MREEEPKRVEDLMGEFTRNEHQRRRERDSARARERERERSITSL